ncbi:NAD(P)/FAD-dependent oxidoreductase [Polluticoccus soli]|uniref:NAD(P)/FAD-dependent oxidoreductase n=1 Tax=Polluticoccus soli TaxID=3034150 RepID=UPI0023E16CAD|nr:NAD(P)/FAD-dependent oxidoreductase [Flavipsychrobacter sp. JY13-12]
MNKIETKAIIIGAGPAGAGTSIYLTQAGIPHVIIEKETFPRDKVCGDACSGKTAFVLRKANPEWLQEIFKAEHDYTPSHGIIFVAPNGKALNIPYNPNRQPGEQAPGFTTPRMTFDNYLFQKLPSPYATIYQQSTIKSIDKTEEKVTVVFTNGNETYEVTAPLIVGADGDKSAVRKQFLNDNSNAKAYAVGLRAYYEGVTGLDKNNFIELHFLPEMLPGYFWIFPLPNGMANVGVGILSERIRAKKINLREQMLNAIKNNPNIRDRFAKAKLVDKIQGWGLPMSMSQSPISGDNFLLTGDAASLIDPFSGEGIGNALYSGMLAAYAIEKSLQSARYDRTFLKEAYDDVLYKRLGDELKISATLQRLCRYPWLFNFVVNKANKSPSLSKTISCMFTDMDLREQLRKPSFYAKILLNK